MLKRNPLRKNLSKTLECHLVFSFELETDFINASYFLKHRYKIVVNFNDYNCLIILDFISSFHLKYLNEKLLYL